MNTQRPTPRTEAETQRLKAVLDAACTEGPWEAPICSVGVEFARDLEHELAEAREKLEKLEACAIHSCGDHCQRPSCKTRREAKAMRAAIQEAEEAFLTFNDVGNCKAFHDAKDKALAALKPFLPETPTE